jgi:ATP-binding cassette subfamily B multidrug efflux pump
VPRVRDRSKDMSEVRSLLTGRIVDSYTNILTVKLFARAWQEDAYVRQAMDQHTDKFHVSLRLNTPFGLTLSLLNALMVTSTGALALAWQIINISGWVAWQVTSIFENVGVVREGMMTIARPITLNDRPQAPELAVTRGAIAFEDVRFHYGRRRLVSEDGRERPFAVLEGFTLAVAPGEKIGLVGRSGAGNSTVVNLLLRFFDLEGGRVLIDSQDIAAVTQESLRAQISVVTQDTSLLHRSIFDNIRYGRPESSEAEVIDATRLAHADEFILGLRRAGRRARRQALGRPAPAHRHRASDPAQRPDLGAGRGDLRARQRDRGRHPVEPRHPEARP